MKQEETRRVALEREESRQRRQARHKSEQGWRSAALSGVEEQEEWEQAMRAKFAEEAIDFDANPVISQASSMLRPSS